MRIERLLLFYKFPALIAINFATDTMKSLIIPMAVLSQHVDVERAVSIALLEQIHQSNIWGSFEWHHEVDYHDICLRFSSAMLFAHFSSNYNKI
jgi:chaperone required for assembly of F1-ATPase